jgi:asparagine synthase (glutamine-hydrolysing)
MCGIVGIYNFGNKKEVSKDILKKMCDVIIHRGPDEEGYYVGSEFKVQSSEFGNIGLGIRRLAIIDLQTGSQPIHNEDSTLWIVCNGEIYNFLGLKEDLVKKGHRFYTKSDVETIIHLYENFGINCLQYLRGMFAFALWDEKKQRLFLARDRVGKKPLYYTIYNGSLVFASEIKSILQYLGTTPEINFEAIDYFLTYQYIPQPITIFKNIFKLPPASYMVCDKNGNIKIEKYWELDFRKKQKITFDEAKQRIREILSEATKLRLISDVPLGAFLSGGHDSSIVVGLMALNSKDKVKTFSVGFKEQDFSELKYARIVAKHFDTDHTEIIVEPKMAEILPKLVWYYDQPFADTSIVPSYYVSNVTRKYVKVALNGDGGDENFCGYLRYPAIKLSSLFPFEILGSKFYTELGKLIPLIETTSAKNKLRYFRRFFTALGNPTPVRQVLWHCFFTNELKNFIYSDFMKSIVKQNVYDYLVNTYYSAKAYDIIDRISYTDINTYLPEDLLVKMDIASMANSLEARSPFLDHNLLEFTSSIPSSWKLGYGFKTKYILKETFKDFLPKEIIKRHKQGFGLPVGKWLRYDLKNFVKEILYSEKFISRNLFTHKNIKILLEKHLSGKEDHGYRIFALIILELWFRIFVDKEKFFVI